MSDVLDLNGATSMGRSNPINNGPINLAPTNDYISFVEIAAL